MFSYGIKKETPVKIPHMAKITAGAGLMLLAACGQGAATKSGASPEETEAAPTGTSENRDWVPAGIVLPQPHTVLRDTKIGTRTYLLQVSVQDDPKAELAQWKSALLAAGYEVNDAMLADGRLLFDGADVESGQIAISNPDDVEGYMIQIDVSQNTP